MVKPHTYGKKCKTVLRISLFVLLLALCGVLLFPPAAQIGKGEATSVVWQSGEREISYAEAVETLRGCDGEKLYFYGGETGEAETGAAFKEVYSVLEGGGLLSLLTIKTEGLGRVERVALYRKFGDTGYYSGDLFAFDGVRVLRTRRKGFGEIVLLDGALSADVLKNSGAKRLVLRGGSRMTAAALVSSQVEEAVAEAPYFMQGNVLSLATAGGARLVAGLPLAEELCASEGSYCDEGAFAPCDRLVSLTAPFIGSAKSLLATDRDGRLSYMFGGTVPRSLERVKATGGVISPFAFTGCGFIKEIDLCGLAEEDVSAQAFYGCERLERLHTKKRGLSLSGGFSVRSLPCGCLLYERKGEEA